MFSQLRREQYLKAISILYQMKDDTRLIELDSPEINERNLERELTPQPGVSKSVMDLISGVQELDDHVGVTGSPKISKLYI